MLNWYMLEKTLDYQEHLIVRSAENHRLLVEALDARPSVATLYDRALDTLGHWLVDRGRDLQDRHGDSNPLPTHTPMRLQSSLPISRLNQDCSIVER